MIFFVDVITNDDTYKFKWPTTFLRIPVVGDHILSNCGCKRAKVISVCHYIHEHKGARVNIKIEEV